MTKTLETSFGGEVELTRLNSYHMLLQFNKFLQLMKAFFFFSPCLLQCAALVGEDQPLCPDLPELDLSELDVNDLDTDSFLGGLKWCSDQSEIISNQYNNEPSNIFEVRASLGENYFLIDLGLGHNMIIGLKAECVLTLQSSKDFLSQVGISSFVEKRCLQNKWILLLF